MNTANSEFLELVKEEVKIKNSPASLVKDVRLKDVRKRMSDFLARQYRRSEKITSPSHGSVRPASGRNSIIPVIRKDWL